MKSTHKNENAGNFIHIPYKCCIICGKAGDVNFYKIRYYSENSTAKLASFFDDFLGLIASISLSTKYIVEAKFCVKCIKQIKKPPYYSPLAKLGFVSTVLLAIVLPVVILDSFGVEFAILTFGFGVIAAIGFGLRFPFVEQGVIPKILGVDEQFVIVEIPDGRRIEYARHPVR